MKIKIICFIIIISALFYFFKNKVDDVVEPDIIISPGGYNGFYQLGICHYIKNHFNYTDKKIVGFSAGSWAGLFLCLDNKCSNECLRIIFNKTKRCCSLTKMPAIFNYAITQFKESDFNLNHLYVCMTNTSNNSLFIKNNFLTIKDCADSCIGSSFVPMVTYNDIFYFYNHKSVADGGMCYKNYIKKINTEKVLVINSSLFKKKKYFSMIRGFFKPKRSLYELYILGYQNAKNNHEYLKKYFHSDS